MTYEEALQQYSIFSNKYMNQNPLVKTDDKTHTHVALRSIKLVEIKKDGIKSYMDDKYLKSKHDTNFTGRSFDLEFFFTKSVIEDSYATLSDFKKLVND